VENTTSLCVPNTYCSMQRPFASHFIQEALQKRAASNFLRHATELLHATSGSNVQHAVCCLGVIAP
jgi:hypothetical protein